MDTNHSHNQPPTPEVDSDAYRVLLRRSARLGDAERAGRLWGVLVAKLPVEVELKRYPPWN